jgi:hypothetical protein
MNKFIEKVDGWVWFETAIIGYPYKLPANLRPRFDGTDYWIGSEKMTGEVVERRGVTFRSAILCIRTPGRMELDHWLAKNTLAVAIVSDKQRAEMQAACDNDLQC